MPRPALPVLPPHTVTVRLPDGRSLIAYLDPDHPNSPLRRALHVAGFARQQGEAPQTDP